MILIVQLDQICHYQYGFLSILSIDFLIRIGCTVKFEGLGEKGLFFCDNKLAIFLKNFIRN